MEKPTQMIAFDALYSIAARDGREEALFGRSIDLARPAYEKTLVGDGYPHAYLEFPLLGEPCFDLLSVHACVKPGSKFAPGAGFGYQAMIDWFSTLGTEEGEIVSCGIELDCSEGEAERAGVYLQQRRRHELVVPFLESVGESGRASSYLDTLSRMPRGWPPAYVGLFPGRAGTPLRIGGYLADEARRACADDPNQLGRAFDAVGFSAYDDAMLERCGEFMALAPSVDFQFDIMADGSLGDTFGLSLSFNEAKPRAAHECMRRGYGARIMDKLEGWGLADERWRLIADAAFARHVGFDREDGTEGRFALCVLFNYAKVKFTAGEARPAKFYLTLKAGEAEYEQTLAETGLPSKMHAFEPIMAPCQAALPNEVHIDELGNIYPHCSFYSVDPSDSVGNLLDEDGGGPDAWLDALEGRAQELCFPSDQPKCLKCKYLPCCLGGCPVQRIEKGEPECPSALFDPDAYAIERLRAIDKTAAVAKHAPKLA